MASIIHHSFLIDHHCKLWSESFDTLVFGVRAGCFSEYFFFQIQWAPHTHLNITLVMVERKLISYNKYTNCWKSHLGQLHLVHLFQFLCFAFVKYRNVQCQEFDNWWVVRIVYTIQTSTQFLPKGPESVLKWRHKSRDWSLVTIIWLEVFTISVPSPGFKILKFDFYSIVDYALEYMIDC